jgi:hypothetical protein
MPGWVGREGWCEVRPVEVAGRRTERREGRSPTVSGLLSPALVGPVSSSVCSQGSPLCLIFYNLKG